VGRTDKPLVWLEGEFKSPPFSVAARIEAGFLLRLLQQGKILGLPHSRPMPVIGTASHELRINDAIVILEIFSKKTAQTPKAVIDLCKRRLKEYDDA